VRTPIWDKANEIDISRYEMSPFRPVLERLGGIMQDIAERGLPPEAIADLVHHALTARRPRTRYTISPERLQLLIGRMLPKRMVDAIIAKRLGLLPTK